MKLVECAEMANLNSRIRDQGERIFKEDWKWFVEFYDWVLATT